MARTHTEADGPGTRDVNCMTVVVNTPAETLEGIK